MKRFIHQISEDLTSWATDAVTHVKAWWHKARSAWDRHVDRMTTDPGYVQAFVDFTTSVVEIITPKQAARYLARCAAMTYIALLHLIRPVTWDEINGPDWA